jgi:hypothetical protein
MTKGTIHRYGWIKWRPTWSYGHDGDWNYEEVVLPFKKTDRDYKAETICEEFEWSEHFRGIDFMRIKHPPLAIFRNLAHHNERSAKRLMEDAKRWRDQIKLLTSKGNKK